VYLGWRIVRIEKDEWPGEHPKTTEVPAKLLRSISRAKLCSEHIHYADQNKVYQSMITMLGMPFRGRSATERTGRYTRKLAAERSPRAPSMQQPNFGNKSRLLEWRMQTQKLKLRRSPPRRKAEGTSKNYRSASKTISRSKICSEQMHYADQAGTAYIKIFRATRRHLEGCSRAGRNAKLCLQLLSAWITYGRKLACCKPYSTLLFQVVHGLIV
jgi:hypothetical protein